MTAKIIETNSTPFAKADVDAVTVDIIENALKNVRVEMDAVLALNQRRDREPRQLL